MAPKLKLMYFNGRGRAEAIRWALTQGGIDYEDCRVEQADWPAVKPTTPLGSMPVLYIDDYALGQSIAIAMYVAREANLVGCNNIEAAQVQMLFESTQEAFNGYAKIVFAGGNDEEKAKKFEEYAAESMATFCGMVEKRLGDKDWLVGNKVSLADLGLVSFLELFDSASEGSPQAMIYSKCPAKILALRERVRNLPKIAKWIAERPESHF